MFRFATYHKLGFHNIVIVGPDAREYRLLSGSAAQLEVYFRQKGAIGFYFHFPDKYHPLGHAFFCRLTHISKFWSQFCPVNLLIQLSRKGLLQESIFPKNKLKTEILGNFLRFIAQRSGGLTGNKFTPHSLRIGGHTFYSIKNLDPDFVHFLGRRAISRACQLYYRASAYDNIIRLDMFFRSIAAQHILYR